MIRLFFSALVLMAAQMVSAQLTENTKYLGVGTVNVLDTYLSPEEYKGTEIRFMDYTTRYRDERKWVRTLIHHASINMSHNRADNNNEMGGMYTFQYQWRRQWKPMPALTLQGGGGVDANIGFLYNTRNSNNPAQARMSLCLSPAGSAAYDFHIGKRPMTVRYDVSVPLVGVMFSPNYGQSYYEIFSRGDYDHNVVATTIADMPSMRQLLTLSTTFKKTTLSIGYMGDYQQAKVNHLKNHTYSHLIMLGIGWRFRKIKE